MISRFSTSEMTLGFGTLLFVGLFAASLVPDYVLPQPGVKYDIDQYTEEWQREVAPKLEERLQKALGK